MALNEMENKISMKGGENEGIQVSCLTHAYIVVSNNNNSYMSTYQFKINRSNF